MACVEGTRGAVDQVTCARHAHRAVAASEVRELLQPVARLDVAVDGALAAETACRVRLDAFEEWQQVRLVPLRATPLVGGPAVEVCRLAFHEVHRVERTRAAPTDAFWTLDRAAPTGAHDAQTWHRFGAVAKPQVGRRREVEEAVVRERNKGHRDVQRASVFGGPRSSTHTLGAEGRAVRRCARTRPAVPAPTITKSNSGAVSVMAGATSAEAQTCPLSACLLESV